MQGKFTTTAFTAAVAGSETVPKDNYSTSVDFSAGVGTVQLQRSFDNGTTWKVADTLSASREDFRQTAGGLLYRFVCTAWTSGTITCIIGS